MSPQLIKFRDFLFLLEHNNQDEKLTTFSFTNYNKGKRRSNHKSNLRLSIDKPKGQGRPERVLSNDLTTDGTGITVKFEIDKGSKVKSKL